MNFSSTQFLATPDSALSVEINASAHSQSREDFFFDGPSITSGSGERVTPLSAMGHGPVWQAVNILSGDVGQLPFIKMIQQGRNREKDKGHPMNFSLRDPNPWQTPSVWKETMMSYALLWGNAISVINRRGKGRVWLVPLMPDVTFYEEVSPGVFVITSRINNKEVVFPYEDCFHLRGLQSNGFWGMSAVQIAKNVIGHGLSLQKHGDKTFLNDATPRGVIQSDESFNAEAHKNLRDEWQQIQGGDNRGKPAILWEGLKWQSISMSNYDAQWLEARKLDREFIASLFNLPAFKLNALENSAVRSNLEEQNRDYFQTSLSRWTNRFAEEAYAKLLTEQERESGDHWFKWFPEAFLRGDITSRYEAYSLGIASTFLSPNEAREQEDLNPYEGGDEFVNPNVQAAEEGEEEVDNSEEVRESARGLIRIQVEAILEIESNRVERAAKTVKNFSDWYIGFYSNNLMDLFNERLLATCVHANQLGVSTYLGHAMSDHEENGIRSLQQITDIVTQGELPEACAEHAIAIRSGVDKLTNAILGK